MEISSSFGETNYLSDLKVEFFAKFTEKLLGRPASVQISKTSGAAGIAYWINGTYRPAEPVDKRDALVVAMKARIDAEYEDGRQTVMSDGELEALVQELAPGRFGSL